jgi:hypothetical protein
MKKIFLVLGISLILVGCQKAPENSPSGSVNPTQPPKDIFSSIADAVQKQMVLKCEYTDEDGGKTMTYIKGQTVRMMGQGDDNKKVDGLMKDGKFYLWSEGNNQGMVIDISKMEGASMGETPVNSIDDVIRVLESQKDKCVVSPESTGLLDLPTDVKFTDSGSIFGGTGQ